MSVIIASQTWRSEVTRYLSILDLPPMQHSLGLVFNGHAENSPPI